MSLQLAAMVLIFFPRIYQNQHQNSHSMTHVSRIWNGFVEQELRINWNYVYGIWLYLVLSENNYLRVNIVYEGKDILNCYPSKVRKWSDIHLSEKIVSDILLSSSEFSKAGDEWFRHWFSWSIHGSHHNYATRETCLVYSKDVPLLINFRDRQGLKWAAECGLMCRHILCRGRLICPEGRVLALNKCNPIPY